MTQLTDEQQERLLRLLVETPAGERIRMKCGAADLRSVMIDVLTLLDSDSHAADTRVSANVVAPTVGAEMESVDEAAAEIKRLTAWQDLCFELLSEIRQWVAPGSITDTDTPRVLRAMLGELARLRAATASTVAPIEQSDSQDRMFVPPAEDRLHIAICNAVQSDQFTASDILRQALLDYQPTKLTRTELIRVQQRSGSGEVSAVMVSPAAAPLAARQDEAHRCPRCGRRMVSEFDEDVGFWRECANCDYREAVSNAPAKPSGAAREAAKEINDLAIAELGRQFYGPVYDRLIATISRHCFSGPAESAEYDERYRAGLQRAAKEVCDACDNEEKYGPAHKIEGSTRWWHGDYPCAAGGIHALLKSTTPAPTTEEGAE